MIGCARRVFPALAALLGAAGLAAAAGPGATAPPAAPDGPRHGHYRGVGTYRNSACVKSREFVYYEPAGSGPAPIAVYLPGTVTRHDDPIFLLYLKRLAQRGYVAVSVDYGQFAVLCSFGCRCYEPRANCLFDPKGSGSLISAVASRTRGDPSKGIVVWGHSQGGYMALMAGNLNPDVRRVVATGATDCAGYYDCIGPQARGLPSDRIRVLIGEHDKTAPPHQAADRKGTPGFLRQLADLTEQPAASRVPGTRSSFRPNGSGFYIVRDEETEEGIGDHRFWQNSEAARGNRIESLDADYLTVAEAPWSLEATIDWLAGACGNGTCERTESAHTCSLDCGRAPAGVRVESRP